MEDYSKASCCIEHDNSKGDIFEGLLSCQLLTTATGLIEVDHLSCGRGRKKTTLQLPCMASNMASLTLLDQTGTNVKSCQSCHISLYIYIYHVIYHDIIARPDVILKRWSRTHLARGVVATANISGIPHLGKGEAKLRLGINRGFPVDPVDQVRSVRLHCTLVVQWQLLLWPSCLPHGKRCQSMSIGQIDRDRTHPAPLGDTIQSYSI